MRRLNGRKLNINRILGTYIKISKLRCLLQIILYTKNSRNNAPPLNHSIYTFNTLRFRPFMQHNISRFASVYIITQTPIFGATVLYEEAAAEFKSMAVIILTYGNNIHCRHSWKVLRLLNHHLFINLYPRYSVYIFALF